MPPKGKAASKPRASDSSSSPLPSSSTPTINTKSSSPSSSASSSRTTATTSPAAPQQPPKTANERSQQRYAAAQPYEALRAAHGGLSGLSPADQTAWLHARLLRSPGARNRLGAKAQRDLWRATNELSLLPRAPKHPPQPGDWGTDPAGRDVGEWPLERFESRAGKRTRLSVLQVASDAFKKKRRRAKAGWVDPSSASGAEGGKFVVTEEEVNQEKERRVEMAALREELYGETVASYALDPEWDDVVPVPQEEPEAALAAIAYPDDYAEAISYLRAVMLKNEYSARCLRLTEDVIAMNPAHYTVWLYRASIIFALKLAIPEEIEWLNKVALENLKNYQIWHHRHLLVEQYYPEIAADPKAVAAFAASERAFLETMLAEDTKNYHVWSYRSYLVRKLGMWDDAELAATASMLDDDVRNNSAWSHRFYVVFSDPAHATTASGKTTAATDPNPNLPAALVDRELAYAMDKARLAPQNQSAWNYLRGVLVKSGRPLAGARAFAEEFVSGLGEEGEEGEGQEVVKSTHALDLLAEIYAEQGDKAQADLCLRRLSDKWDRIRGGYWAWRRKALEE